MVRFCVDRGIEADGLTPEPVQSTQARRQQDQKTAPRELRLGQLMNSHERSERDGVPLEPFGALPRKMPGKIGPRTLDQGPKPARRLFANPRRLAK
jgi:hypothetical protein